jgi:hypothetical protein
MKLNGIHQLLSDVNGVHGLGDSVGAMKRNKKNSFDDSKEVGLAVSGERTKYMLLSRHQIVDQNRYIRKATRSLETVSQFLHSNR